VSEKGKTWRTFASTQERDDYILDKLMREHPNWTINQIIERKEQVLALHGLLVSERVKEEK
jgi:hypothetical protein